MVLNQGSVNYGPRAISSQLAVFRNRVFGTQTHLFIYVFSVAAFMLQWQNSVSATETAWPTEPEIFTI